MENEQTQLATLIHRSINESIGSSFPFGFGFWFVTSHHLVFACTCTNSPNIHTHTHSNTKHSNLVVSCTQLQYVLYCFILKPQPPLFFRDFGRSVGLPTFCITSFSMEIRHWHSFSSIPVLVVEHPHPILHRFRPNASTSSQ